MTEDDAKTKVCPQTLGVTKAMEAVSRPVPYVYCVASECMAWRWRTVANPEWKPDSPMGGWPDFTNPYNKVKAGMNSTTDGYCGLAGHLGGD